MMEKDAKIYVAGHRGMVGSAIVRELQRQGYTNLVTRTHRELDLCRQEAVERFFAEEKPEYVFLAAAKVGGIVANESALADFMYDIFDVSFGNRILNQIVKFVPVYVACGGTAAKALDLMFSRKVMRKLEGRFDDEMKDNLDKLEKLVLNMFGKKEFSETLEVIARLKRKML